MQIGTHWNVGEAMPPGVPEPFAAGILEAEARLDGGAWVLTWLEGKPVAEHSGGLRLVADAEGRAVRADESAAVPEAFVVDDDDDWLH